MTLQIGDHVSWASHNHPKQGEVVAIMESNHNLNCLPWSWLKRHTLMTKYNAPRRPFKSYLVEVMTGGMAKPKLYWPDPNQLKLEYRPNANVSPESPAKDSRGK